ncbi:MAG: lipid A export permease/ATP-binding protein MsbA [Gammaproteobacteria bacterium]|nr:MAG: lipid A export permease/ATP-binding protein MsbA [Gammaproteobacteria bacterium]
MSLDSTTVYRRLLGQALPHWRIFAIGIIAMIANGLADTAFAWLMKPLMDEGFAKPDPQLALMFAIAIIVIFFLRGLTSFLASYCISWVGRKVVTDMREKMFNHLVMMPSRYYDHASSGELLSRLTYNTEQVAGAATKAVTVLISDSFKVIFQLALMFYLSIYLSLGFLIIAPIVAGLVLIISKRLRKISKNIQDSMGHVTHVAEEAISGQLVVKSFGGQEYEKGQYRKAVNRNRTQSMKLVATDELNVPLIQFMVALVLSGAVYVVISGYLPEAVTGGTFAAYVIALSVMLPSVKRLTAINAVLQRGIAAGQSIYTFLDELPETDSGTMELKRGDFEIEYRDVRFRYTPDKDDVLDGITFSIPAGSMAAFVGKSGGGKSTLVSLLPRFYDADSGDILVNGIAAKEIRLDSLRSNISYVGQQVTLFNDTVRHNIAYGRLEDASEDDIIKAAKRAHAWEFIEKLPQGLETLVGEDGILLSGGQRQRLAIARALLKDAPILILDEATSALDSESEKYIQAGLEALMQGRTTLVIAHRLSTIERADTIHVVDAGKIVESGNHENLLAQNGMYAALYRMQFSDAASSDAE